MIGNWVYVKRLSPHVKECLSNSKKVHSRQPVKIFMNSIAYNHHCNVKVLCQRDFFTIYTCIPNIEFKDTIFPAVYSKLRSIAYSQWLLLIRVAPINRQNELLHSTSLIFLYEKEKKITTYRYYKDDVTGSKRLTTPWPYASVKKELKDTKKKKD